MVGRETLQDRALRHAAMLRRYENGEVRRILAFIERDLLPDILDVLRRRMARIDQRGYDLGPWTSKRLTALYQGLGIVVDQGMSAMHASTKAGLIELAGLESAFQANILAAALPDVLGYTPALPAPALLRSIVTSRPFEGRILSEWFGRQKANLKHTLRTEIRKGIAQGETIAQMTKRISGAMGGTKHGAESIVITATNHVTSQASIESIRANRDVYKGWRFLATLDEKTCFAAGTLVRCANGQPKAIEEIGPGEFVISGNGQPRRVLGTKIAQAREWVSLTVAGVEEAIVATATHPFWALRRGGFGWVEAQSLEPGHQIGGISLCPLRETNPELRISPEEVLQPSVLREQPGAMAAQEMRMVRKGIPCTQGLCGSGEGVGVPPDSCGGAEPEGHGCAVGSPCHDVEPEPTGTFVVTACARTVEDPKLCYDLVIADDHSYLVGPGLIAHNTLECASLDGNVYALDDNAFLPPRHFRCRSRPTGELKSYKDLGIDLPDTDPLSRAAAGGPVPGDLDYQGWLERMDADPKTRHYVVDSLGPKRAKLWREGVHVKRFTSATAEPLTLVELGRKEGIEV